MIIAEPDERIEMVGKSYRLYEQAGVTLLELLVAVAASIIIITAGFSTLTNVDRAARANSQTVDTQQNGRTAMEIISRDLKVAGFGMIGPVGGCVSGVTAAAIVPSDQNSAGPTTAVNDIGPDRISMVLPLSSTVAPLWTLSAAVTGGNQITLQPAVGAAPTSVGDMKTKNGGSLLNATISIGGAMTATVTANPANSATALTIGTNIVPPMSFPAGTTVYLLQCVTYQVITPPDNNNLCGGNAPCLVRGVVAGNNCDIAGSPCSVVVDGIEDLQFAYGCDGCNPAVNGGTPDRIIDDQNGSNSFDPADLLSNYGALAAGLDPTTIRLAQVSIVSRQTTPDQGLGEKAQSMTATSGPLVVADHNHALGIFGTAASYNVGTYYKYRRRLLVRTVETRNIGLPLL